MCLVHLFHTILCMPYKGLAVYVISFPWHNMLSPSIYSLSLSLSLEYTLMYYSNLSGQSSEWVTETGKQWPREWRAGKERQGTRWDGWMGSMHERGRGRSKGGQERQDGTEWVNGGHTRLSGERERMREGRERVRGWGERKGVKGSLISIFFSIILIIIFIIKSEWRKR